MKVLEIEGVGTRYAEKLVAAGITTDAELLERGHTRKGRADDAPTSPRRPACPRSPFSSGSTTPT